MNKLLASPEDRSMYLASELKAFGERVDGYEAYVMADQTVLEFKIDRTTKDL